MTHLVKTLLTFLVTSSLTHGKVTKAHYLNSASQQTIDLSSPSVFVFFKEQCSACRQQSHQVGCLKVPIYFVGLGENVSKLKREYRRMNHDGITYLKSNKEMEAIMSVNNNNTPQIIIQGPYSKIKRQGLHQCHVLNQLVKKVSTSSVL